MPSTRTRSRSRSTITPGGLDADVGGDQAVLDLLPGVLVEVVAGEHGEQAAAERVLRAGEPGPQPDHPAGGGLRPVQRPGASGSRQLVSISGGRPPPRPAPRAAAPGSSSPPRRRGGDLAPADPRHHQADGPDDQHDQQNQDGDQILHAEILTDAPRRRGGPGVLGWRNRAWRGDAWETPAPGGPPCVTTPTVTAQLLIGPVLRRVTGDRATIWVETSRAGGRAGRGRGRRRRLGADIRRLRAPLRDRGGRRPGAGHRQPYRVLLDDRPVWPPADSTYPPSVIRTRAADDRDQPVRLVFGSCREATPKATGRELPPDALDAYARRLMADPANPEAAAGPDRAARRPGVRGQDLRQGAPFPAPPAGSRPPRQGPVDQVVSFEEYTKLYLESWRDPELRWLLATVPSLMIFDDHEIIDDWNTSASWRADMSGSRGGTSGSPAAWPRTGSTSTWATWARTSSPPTRSTRGSARSRTHRAAARLRPRGGRAELRRQHGRAVPVELRAGHRPHPDGHAGQPLQPGAHPGPAGDAAARASGTGSSTRPTATTTTWWSARRCRG